MVREGWKCLESVWRGSSIGHKCWNMCSEPGVAHQRKEHLVRNCTWKSKWTACLSSTLFMSYQPLLTPSSSVSSNPGDQSRWKTDHLILDRMFWCLTIQRCCRVSLSDGSRWWWITVWALATPKFSGPGSLWVTRGTPKSCNGQRNWRIGKWMDSPPCFWHASK